MADSSVLIIGAVVAALVLSYVYVRWRIARRKSDPTRTAADALVEQAAPAGLGTGADPGPAATEPDSPSLLRRFPFAIGVIALGAAGLGQYAVRTDRIGLAWVGYLVGGLLFVGAVRPTTPVTYTAPAPVDDTPVDKTKLTRARQAALAGGASLLQNWRYYTLADILRGRQPRIPQPAAELQAPPAAQPETAEASRQVEAARGAGAAVVSSPAAATVSGPQRASVSVWTGFGRPESLAVAGDGRVFILDSDRRRIFELESTGQVLREWPVQLEGLGPAYQLAVSPDGRSVYVVDATHSRVLRIALEN